MITGESVIITTKKHTERDVKAGESALTQHTRKRETTKALKPGEIRAFYLREFLLLIFVVPKERVLTPPF